MDGQGRQGGGAVTAMQEFCYGGGGGQPEVADGAFLMELMDESTPAAEDQYADDRLSRVIRSLEAEIGSTAKAPAPAPAAAVGDGETESTVDGPPASDDDGGLEDMLSDLDGSPCSAGAAPPALQSAAAPFEYWAEEPPAMAGHDMGGWYVDVDGAVVGYELREQCYYTYGDGSSVEQVYSPLWE